MAEQRKTRQDGSQPERGTGQRQDHRAAPPGHRLPGEGRNLDDPDRETTAGAADRGPRRERDES